MSPDHPAPETRDNVAPLSPILSATEFADRDELLDGSLGRLLEAHIEVEAVLPLVFCLNELIDSLRHARLTAWRADQRRSLAADIQAAVEVPGTELRAELRSLLNEVHELGQRLLPLQHNADFAGHPDLKELLIKADILRTRLAQPASLRACWRDLVAGVLGGLTEHELEDRMCLLFAMLEAAHHDIDATRRHLHWVIADGGIPWGEVEQGHELPSISERLAECESFLGTVTASGHCTCWVALDRAQLPNFVVETGSVTFFDAQWAVPNAEHNHGQDFIYRQELRTIAVANAFESVPKAPNVVLARVDLGHRPVAGALDEAWRRAMFIAGYATLSAQTDPWPKRGWYCLSVDGALAFGWFAPDEMRGEPNSFQIDRTSSEFSRIAETMGKRGAWSSPDIMEAVDCAIEARRADVRNRNLLRWRVLEMSAAYAGFGDVDELLALLKGQWAYGHLRSQPVRKVTLATMHHKQDSPYSELARSLYLALIKHKPGGRVTVLMRDALTLRVDLLKVSRTTVERRSLNTHLDTLCYPSKTLDRLTELNRDEDLLFSRMRRVRNSLTHGNPVTIEAIASVDNYVMYLTEFALQELIMSPVGTTPSGALVRRNAEQSEARARLRAGDDPVEVLGII